MGGSDVTNPNPLGVGHGDPGFLFEEVKGLLIRCGRFPFSGTSDSALDEEMKALLHRHGHYDGIAEKIRTLLAAHAPDVPTQDVVPSESAGTQTAAGSPSEQSGAADGASEPSAPAQAQETVEPAATEGLEPAEASPEAAEGTPGATPEQPAAEETTAPAEGSPVGSAADQADTTAAGQ
jgi:hypothetical protein